MDEVPDRSPKFCTQCGAPLPADAKFCAQCGAPVADGGRPPSPPAAPPEPEAPPELRAKYESARQELRGDRREVVVLFADLSGFTAMSERMDAEDVGFVMQGLLSDLADVVYRYEGYVDKYIGDAIMALFGAPIAHENDPERAVLAALDMLKVTARRSEGAETPLSLRVGLNLGEVVAAHVGSESRHQYTVMGDTVNVASRLEGAAEPDTVLVSRAVFERTASRFEFEEREPITVKGKSEPLQTYRVVRYRAGPTDAGGATTSFVGRDAELDSVAGFLSRVPSGNGDVLLIEAEAGAGKTRLVDEAIASTDTKLDVVERDFTEIDLPGQLSISADLFANIVDVHPDEDDRGRAVARAAALLGDDRHGAGIESLANQLFPEQAETADTDIAPGLARQNRWLALTALMTARAAERPLLVRLEDAHWASEADREFLAFLLPQLEPLPIGVVVTARLDADLEWIPASAERIRLQRLGEQAAREILGGFFEGLPPSERKELIRRSQGNPFYLEQLARALRDSPGTTASVPGTIQTLLQSRIDQLDEPVRLLLQMASVLGATFPIPLLRRVYRLETQPVPFDEALRRLAREGFLEVPEDNGSGRFQHALLLEVAYGAILQRLRKVLHESVARLGEEHFADRLEVEAPFFAHHFWEAGLRIDAAPHLWHAGRGAVQAYELHAAERFFGRLAEALEEEPAALGEGARDTEFVSAYALVLKERGRFADADTWFQRLLRDAEQRADGESVCRALFQRGAVALYQGKPDEAKSFFERGLAQCPADDRIRADLHSGMGMVHYFAHALDRALEAHGEALSLRERSEDRFGYVKSLLNIGNVHRLKNETTRAREHYNRALEIARDNGDREIEGSLVLNLGTLDLELGDYRSALERFVAMQELAEEVGLSRLRFLSLRNQAVCYVRLGRLRAAISALVTCLREGDAVLDPANRVAVRIVLFEAHFAALDDAGATDWLAQARDLAAELEVTEQEDWLTLAEARLAGTRADWKEIASAYRNVVEIAERLEETSTATIARAQHWRARARAGEEIDTRMFDTEAPPALAALAAYLAADATAATGDPTSAAERLDRAARAADSVGDLSLARAAHQRRAELLAELGDADGERTALHAAREAMLSLRAAMPEDLRAGFDAHPRNAALLETADA